MRHWLLISLLLGSSAHALTMGDIKVSSGFNQPLSATIPIELSANTDFKDYQIILDAVPAGMPSIEIKFDPSQSKVIKLTTKDPVNFNHIQFNVLVKNSREELNQAYTINFDKKSPAKGPKPLVYGPVKGGETLWNVGKAFSEHYKISLDEAMQQLYQSNPKAFVQGKKDALMAGSYLRLPSQHKQAEVKVSQSSQSPVKPKVTRLKETVKQEVAESLPPLPELNEQGKDLAINLDKVSGSLELLNPAETLQNMLGQHDQAFTQLLDNIQSELSLSREAIDTEKRAKEALQVQLNDLQIQVKALTELVSLKDAEMKSLLSSQRLAPAVRSAETSNRFIPWDQLPQDTAHFLSAATHNQFVLLLMAVVVASFMVYVWDHLSLRRQSLRPVPAQPSFPARAATVKTQPLHQPGFMLQDIDVYVAHGRYAQAEDLLEQALSQHPTDFDLLYKLFQVYVKSDNRFAYENKVKRISGRWKQKYPVRWKRVQDLYDRAWPMGFEAHGNGGAGGEDAYEGDPPSDPVQTKLDLAKAYIDIGNHDNAVEILMEVVNEGSEAQILAAQMLLSNIKH